MSDTDKDKLIFEALTTPEGKLFHAWLVNTHIMQQPSVTDPSEALVYNARAGVVREINNSYSRHMQKLEGKNAGTSREDRPGRRSK